VVTFTLAERANTHEPVAHAIVRTGEGDAGGVGGATGGAPSRREFVAEKNPNAIKFTSNQAAGARGSMSARLARAPGAPGDRGFSAATSPAGRGRLLAEREAARAAGEGSGALSAEAAEFEMPPLLLV